MGVPTRLTRLAAPLPEAYPILTRFTRGNIRAGPSPSESAARRAIAELRADMVCASVCFLLIILAHAFIVCTLSCFYLLSAHMSICLACRCLGLQFVTPLSDILMSMSLQGLGGYLGTSTGMSYIWGRG